MEIQVKLTVERTLFQPFSSFLMIHELLVNETNKEENDITSVKDKPVQLHLF